MWPTVVQLAVGLASATAVVLAARATWRGNTAAKRIEATAAPYAVLVEELANIKTRLFRLETEVDRTRRVALILLDERHPEAPLRPEVVAWLSEHYPHRLIGDYDNKEA